MLLLRPPQRQPAQGEEALSSEGPAPPRLVFCDNNTMNVAAAVLTVLIILLAAYAWQAGMLSGDPMASARQQAAAEWQRQQAVMKSASR